MSSLRLKSLNEAGSSRFKSKCPRKKIAARKWRRSKSLKITKVLHEIVKTQGERAYVCHGRWGGFSHTSRWQKVSRRYFTCIVALSCESFERLKYSAPNYRQQQQQQAAVDTLATAGVTFFVATNSKSCWQPELGSALIIYYAIV